MSCVGRVEIIVIEIRAGSRARHRLRDKNVEAGIGHVSEPVHRRVSNDVVKVWSPVAKVEDRIWILGLQLRNQRRVTGVEVVGAVGEHWNISRKQSDFEEAGTKGVESGNLGRRRGIDLCRSDEGMVVQSAKEKE